MFFHTGKKTAFEEAYIEAVGRALCIAQNFESNCRGLANLLDIKASDRKAIDVEFEKLIEKLSRRMLAGAIEGLGKHVELPEKVTEILEAAKDARNCIAHDSMKTLFERSEIEGRLSVDLVELRKAVRALADADGMVAAWCFGVSENQNVSSTGYSNDVDEWVFSEFSPEDFQNFS